MEPDFLYNKNRRFEIIRHRLWPSEYPITTTRGDIRPYRLTEGNRQKLKEFLFYLEKQNYALYRKERLLDMVARLMEMHGKDFATTTKEEIQGPNGLVIKVMEEWPNDTTKEMYLQALRQFFKFLYQSDEYPEPVRGIKFQKKKGRKLLDIPPEEKVAELIHATPNPIHKAMLSTLYASAGRIGEISTLKVRDLEFNGDECIVSIHHSKTDQRKVLLVDSSVQLLREALLAHPKKDSPNFRDTYLFVSVDPRSYAQPYTYAAIAKILKECARKINLSGLHPHLLRHARATHLIQRGLSETKLKVFLGHSFSSRHTGRYLHLASKDVFDSIRTVNGKQNVPEKINPFMPKICGICSFANDSSQILCKQCQRPLGLNERLEYHDKLSQTEDKMMRLERSMNILLESLRQSGSQTLNNPGLAKVAVETARINTNGGIQNG